MAIWDYQQTVSRRLLGWSALSVAAGVSLLRGDEFQRGLGWQAIGWGATDAAIAVVGGRTARRRQAAPDTADAHSREARTLSRLLWLNAGLDLLYMLGGRALAERSAGRAVTRGTGWGIVVQGAFLFLFDIHHALHIPRREQA